MCTFVQAKITKEKTLVLRVAQQSNESLCPLCDREIMEFSFACVCRDIITYAEKIGVDSP